MRLARDGTVSCLMGLWQGHVRLVQNLPGAGPSQTIPPWLLLFLYHRASFQIRMFCACRVLSKSFGS